MLDESKSILFSIDYILCLNPQLDILIYNLKDDSDKNMVNFFRNKNIDKLIGILSKEDSLYYYKELEDNEIILYNIAFPFESDICFRSMYILLFIILYRYQLNNIDDYVGFISYLFLLSDPNHILLLYYDSPLLESFNNYLLYSLNKFRINIPIIKISSYNINTKEVMNIIFNKLPDGGEVVLSMNKSMLEMFISFLSKINKYKISTLFYYSGIEEYQFNYFNVIDEFDRNYKYFPYLMKYNIDTFGVLFYKAFQFSLLSNDSNTRNDYNQINHSIFIYNSSKFLIQIPFNSTAFNRNDSIYERYCKYSNDEIVNRKLLFSVGVLLDEKNQVMSMINGFSSLMMDDISSISKTNRLKFNFYYIFCNNNKIKEFLNEIDEIKNKTHYFIGLTAYLFLFLF